MQPTGELLLRLGTVARRPEGVEGIDAQAHLGFGERGVVTSSSGDPPAEPVPVGGDDD